MPPVDTINMKFRGRDTFRSRNLDRLAESRRQLVSRLDPRALEFLEDFRAYRTRPTVEHLMEHLGPDLFANITLDAQHKRMVKGYQEVPAVWRRLVNVRNVSDFKLQQAIAAGGFDDLPVVGPNGEYKYQDMPDEGRGSYRLVKHGALFGLTLEAQANDELDAFGERVQKWGRAAARTRDKFVLQDNLDANPVVYDGLELIGSTHANWIGTGALSATTIKAGITLMRKQKGIPQTDGTTPDDIEVMPRLLIVHPDDEWTARQILESGALIGQGADAEPVGNKNVLQGRLELVVTVRVTSGRYYLAADPGDVDMFELGVYQGQSEPEMFAEDPSTGTAFAMDVMRWKVRDIFNGTWRDWRGIAGGGFADPH